jgi:uncharacterized protein with PQ loop repeat
MLCEDERRSVTFQRGRGDAVVAELLGWFGAGLSCVISLPQVVRTMRAKRLDGISCATYWLVLANAAAWTAWSLLTGEHAAGVPALINGPVAVVILHRLVATRHTARRSEFDAEVRETYPCDSLTSWRQPPTDPPRRTCITDGTIAGTQLAVQRRNPAPWSGDLPPKGSKL